jgi:3-methyladenine DNA glycosylase AlkC
MEPLKNLFNKSSLQLLSDDLRAVYPEFDSAKLNKLVFDKQWENLELKERMHHIALCLQKVLPVDYKKALNVILKAAETRLPKRKGEFSTICLPDFVATFGLDYPEISLDALAVLTPFPSSEFAVRPFILRYPDITIKKFYEWSKSGNHHIRRFASEGCRPRLPWGMAIPAYKKDPSPILPVLETLIDDPSEYVRKSVANSLNDISKDNPAVFMEFVTKWFGKSDNVNKVLKHASRTLLKKGNPAIMKIFGFEEKKKTKIADLDISPLKVKIGGQINFSFSLVNKEKSAQKLRLEYKIYYAKNGGKLSSKIFRISESIYEPGKNYQVKKVQSFQDMTTRKHYKGKHKLVIVVNGAEAAEKEFEVI